MHHLIVEIAKIVVTQIVIVHKVPLATRILVTPAIALAWEIYPFGMAELVAHKVEITAIDCRGRYEAYHFVQCDATVYGFVLIAFLEMPIHIGINQTEYQCFIAYKCLVVAFAIRDGFLVGTAVGKFPSLAEGLAF